MKFDEKALREIIINALVHNDYTNEDIPQFDIFAEELKFPQMEDYL